MNDFKVGDKVRVKRSEEWLKHRFGQILVIGRITKDKLWFDTNCPHEYWLLDCRVEKINHIQNKLK